MATLEQALEIAARAHAGAVGKDGQEFILHPLRVMLGVQDPQARIVAVLHDVVEDTDVTLDELRAYGFADAVLDAVARLTRHGDEPYAEYVQRCRGSELARQVKLADLRDNAHLARVPLRPESFSQDAKRLHRYVLAYKFLSDELSADEYVALMTPLEP